MSSKYKLVTSFTAVLLLAVSASAMAYQGEKGRRLTLNFKGSSELVRTIDVPDRTGLNLSANGMLSADCYAANVFDLKSGLKLGTAEDCLSVIAVGGDSASGSGLQVVGTTIFDLYQGKLVIQGLTSVQPVNWPTANAVQNFTHITGANSSSNAVVNSDGQFPEFRNTGLFRRVMASSRLSGQVDLSAAPGTISFDCIFVVDIRAKN